jgi:PHP domain
MASHDHPHGHSHDHDHDHTHAPLEGDVSPALDQSIPDSELSPKDLSRRGLLARGGVLGAAGLAGSMLGLPEKAAAQESMPTNHTPFGGYRWLAGDHHIHTRFSSDAQYRVADHVQHAAAYGLDWMVITDHGSVQHAKIGVEVVNPEIVDARKLYKNMLVFQGLEWNIPSAEHGTVFVHPGSKEVPVLKEFENTFDGVVNGTTANTPANEQSALDGLDFLAASVSQGNVRDALFLANHPARKGIDSPHEIRNWRDQQPRIAIGMEGAPGHQAAGIAAPNGPGSARGYYDFSPSADSFAGYPLESYRTWGGFDWMSSTVGGLWDSLLAEGKPWWITSNSDSHQVWLDDSVRGPNSDFTTNGFYDPPVHGPTPQATFGDFWPGYYSRTHVGTKGGTYAQLMSALRLGRVWVDHGRLVEAVDVRVRVAGSGQTGVPLGGALHIRNGARVEIIVKVKLQTSPNWAQFVPKLARVDVIQGNVTGAAADLDSFNTPSTKVVRQFDVSQETGVVTLKYDLGSVHGPVYLRVRGTDGNRSAVGLNGAGVDPAGPAMDVEGDADPWNDLWFYTNPIWVLPRS